MTKTEKKEKNEKKFITEDDKKTIVFATTLMIVSAIVMALLPLKILSCILSFVMSVVAIPVLAIVVIIGIATTVNKRKGKKSDIIFETPENHKFVFRTAILSNPGEPDWGAMLDDTNRLIPTDEAKKELGILELKDLKKSGKETALAKFNQKRDPRNYFELPEGLGIFLPGLFIDHGMVSMKPKQKDLDHVKVTSRDSQIMFVDVQMTSQIWNAKRFVAQMPGETIAEKEKEREKNEIAFVRTALNRICGFFTADELTAGKVAHPDYTDEEGKEDEEKIRKFGFVKGCNAGYKEGEELTDKWGREIKSSVLRSPDKDCKKFGIFIPEGNTIELGGWTKDQLNYGLCFKDMFGVDIIQLGIQQINSPDEVQAAMARRTAAQIELEAAPDEAAADKKLIKETGANANVVVLRNAITDLLRSLVGKGAPTGKNN